MRCGVYTRVAGVIMFNRRSFVKKLLAAAAMTCIAIRFPLEALPPLISKPTATAYVTKVWNDYAKGKGFSNLSKMHMVASPDMYEALCQELTVVQRFTTQDSIENTIKFKALSIYKLKPMPGETPRRWFVEVKEGVRA